MSVKHLQYVRVFSLSSLKCLVLALNRHFKPRIALTFISNSVLLYPFFYTCRKSMKATIWSAMVPSHTPQHRTEKRTQNTNWKTVHMLDSTIWWKAEYSHLVEKKTLLWFTHSQILSPHRPKIPIIFIQLCGSTFCSETLFPPFFLFFRVSLPIPLRALFF